MANTSNLRLKLLIESPNGSIDSAGIALDERSAQVKLISRIADIAETPAVGYKGIIINLETREVHTLTYNVTVLGVPIDTNDYHRFITWQPDPNKTKVFCSHCGCGFYTKEPNYMRPILCDRHKEKGERYVIIEEPLVEVEIPLKST